MLPFPPPPPQCGMGSTEMALLMATLVLLPGREKTSGRPLAWMEGVTCRSGAPSLNLISILFVRLLSKKVKTMLCELVA